jgi:hypothetical protein
VNDLPSPGKRLPLVKYFGGEIMMLFITTALLHLDVEKVLAFGIIVYIWNHLGLGEKPTLIGNIVGIILLVILMFIL